MSALKQEDYMGTVFLADDATVVVPYPGLMGGRCARPESATPIRDPRKRAMDIVISATMLFLAMPVMLAIAVLVRRDGGAALFGHDRIGENGRVFRCLKFRSMAVNADELLKTLLANDESARAEWNETQKLRRDPRITRLGRFLRATSLDELPQLLNILRGDMSLVGPRPIVRAEIERYGDNIAYYYATRPGLTGLWQVSGRSNTSYARRVALDSTYVRQWTFRKDVLILLKTIPAVLRHDGAH
ncbi:sugar transferase [Gluconacetobacter sacchari]|uniref:Exopolysaccharide biosynthesis protein n=2 Tax=Gluconacetobacter sacchari TaxID=92759 RepID=A0A7W4ICX8_9PROT|nr:sugar transferase [Gluconacetobacter sacchari]MBB2160563.1 exopolysaccharide biosynthesis protein [Gluconacetobacter sacchari]GBQ33070.1 sugar transferase [Gluconacetobacter sacchari DSM 12717]